MKTSFYLLRVALLRIVIGCLILPCLSCFAQDKAIDPNVLVPLLGEESHEAVTRLVGDSYQVRTIDSSTSVLPLKFQKIQVRSQGVLLIDDQGIGFPVLPLLPPEVRKIESANTLREIFDLMAGVGPESNDRQSFIIERNGLEMALGMLRLGEGVGLTVNVAYTAKGKVYLVSIRCYYPKTGKRGDIDTPFLESSVSCWISPRFPANIAR